MSKSNPTSTLIRRTAIAARSRIGAYVAFLSERGTTAILFAISMLLILLVAHEVSRRLSGYVLELSSPLPVGNAILQHTIVALVHFLFVVVPLIGMEQLFPTSRPPIRSYAIGLAGWALAWALGYFVGLATQASISLIGLSPMLVVKVSNYNSLAVAALYFVSLFLFDFFYYWFHRLQHAVPSLWRLHAVHHSIKELNSVMSFHHPLEDMLRIVPMMLPLAFIVRFEDWPVIPLLTAFLSAQGQFIHTDSRVSFGPARVFLADGRYHRIHHSEDKKHHDTNFAAFFPVWDWLFGTMHLPVRGERVNVGLKSRPNGMTVRDYFFGIPGREPANSTVSPPRKWLPRFSAVRFRQSESTPRDVNNLAPDGVNLRQPGPSTP